MFLRFGKRDRPEPEHPDKMIDPVKIKKSLGTFHFLTHILKIVLRNFAPVIRRHAPALALSEIEVRRRPGGKVEPEIFLMGPNVRAVARDQERHIAHKKHAALRSVLFHTPELFEKLPLKPFIKEDLVLIFFNEILSNRDMQI